MNIRLPFSWFEIRNSLWYRPAIMTTIAILLSFLTVWLDHVLFRKRDVEAWWLFEGGAEGARGVLTAIAGTMMAVATTAFSFTLVALQLSSSQYSPRVVRNFTGDRSNQLVIGAFVSTFVYTLLVLRVVRSESADLETFVPAVSVSVALLLAMLCIGSLIFFFHHATRTIQASVIIWRAAEQTHRVIESTSSRNGKEHWHLLEEPIERPSGLKPVGVVRGEESGYLQDVALEDVLELATSYNLLVEINARPGDFLLSSDPLCTLWSYGDPKDDPTEQKAEEGNVHLLDRFDGVSELGLERTLERDALYGLQQVVDIALRAISPAVNDPTTANICIDHIGELLVSLEPIACQEAAQLDDEAVLRVIQPQIPWKDYVETAFVQIRHYGAGDVMVAVHILRTIRRIVSHVRPQSRTSLIEVAEDVVHAAMKVLEIERDRQMLREEMDRLIASV